MKIVDEWILFFFKVSLSKFSLEALFLSWVKKVFILGWEWNVKSQVFQNKVSSRLDWVASSSHEVTERLVVLYCPVVLQLAWCFNFWHAWHVSNFWRLAATSHPRDPVASLCFSCTLLSISSHYLTHLPLQESHLNIGLLFAKIQANLAWNKANKMVDKIQPYIYDLYE